LTTYLKSNQFRGSDGTGKKKEKMETLEVVKQFKEEKRFYTRGLPLAKKIWRDGYNKAIDDLITYILMKEEETGPDNRPEPS